MMHLAEFSLQGPKAENQDTIYTNQMQEDCVLGLVADGVGGLGAGKLASLCVLKAAEESIADNVFEPEKILLRAHDHVNNLKVERAATTATIIFCEKGILSYAHTGDSRIYLLRGKGVKTLTTDQTEAEFLVNEGVITKAAARTYPRRNVLMHALEKGEKPVIVKGKVDLKSGDRILILTDGVYKLISKKTIQEISTTSSNASKLRDSIHDLLVTRLDDDASLVVVDIT